MPQSAEEYYEKLGAGSIAADILRSKYLHEGESGPEEMWQRVAQAIASVEKPSVREAVNARFLSALTDFKFIPGGRINHGAGASHNSTLTNCYVIEIEEDSIPAIYQTLTDEAYTYKAGGGVGHDLSILRPRGAAIGSTGGESCGPVGFMDLYSMNTNTISQHGRRGANMQTLRVDHPDIEEFIHIKMDAGRSKVKYSNISVLITDEFMEAVKNDHMFSLKWGGMVYRQVNARELWDKIISAAHESAEPGIIFWDRMKQYHNGEYCSPLVSTNPCGEQPLPNGGSCNLGAINLAMMVKPNGTRGKFVIDWDLLVETTETGTIFMDDVISYNLDRHPLEQQRKNAENQRRIGLGITGLADMLIKLQIPYDSEEAIGIIEKVMKTIRDTAYKTSIQLAKEKGAFPDFKWEGYQKSKFVKSLPKEIRDEIREHGIRNVTLLTVAPVGTGSIIAGVSSGVEPIFKVSYERKVKQGDGEQYELYDVYHPVVHQLFVSEDKPIPDYVREAHQVDPYFRVRMQSVLQKYIDSSISSTVNLPESAEVETVRAIYEYAYEQDLKGITVYREGSREGILTSKEKKEPESIKEENTHPYDTGRLLAPVPRPKRVSGITEEVRTAQGDMLVTINGDDQGRIVEVIARVGKAGGDEAAQSEAIGRLISTAVRSGVNPSVIVKQLKGITAEPTWHIFPGEEKATQILSTADGLARTLERYLKSQEAKELEVINDQLLGLMDPQTNNIEAGLCPECHEMTLVQESGCDMCYNCGHSGCKGS